jgi:hypothetical protein
MASIYSDAWSRPTSGCSVSLRGSSLVVLAIIPSVEAIFLSTFLMISWHMALRGEIRAGAHIAAKRTHQLDRRFDVGETQNLGWSMHVA